MLSTYNFKIVHKMFVYISKFLLNSAEPVREMWKL
jgi:hypothetical protein